MRAPDVTKFFDAYRREFGSLRSIEQVKALEELIHFMAADATLHDVRDAAYMLATVKHETADTFLPVREAYWKDEAWRARNLRYHPWYGRGYVQLTWEDNYRRAGAELGRDLTTDPDVVMVPELAYQIMSAGMRLGWFTGKRLGDYIDRQRTQYVSARRIINGTDRAGLIARYAEQLEHCLGAACFSEPRGF